MITGKVNSAREPVIQLVLTRAQLSKFEYRTDAVIDTGFTGYLTVSPEIVERMSLPKKGHGRAILADGTEAAFDVVLVELRMEGQTIQVPAEVTESVPLIGMALLDGYILRLDASPGGDVSLVKRDENSQGEN